MTSEGGEILLPDEVTEAGVKGSLGFVGSLSALIIVGATGRGGTLGSAAYSELYDCKAGLLLPG